MNKQILASILADQQETVLSHSVGLIPRAYDLSAFARAREIAAISGVRRVGKSSLLHCYLAKSGALTHPVYVNFDDPRLLSFEAKDFETLYQLWIEAPPFGDQPRHIAFDEIQNIPGWERWVLFFAEQKGFATLISGSNSKLLSSELSTHLTGRHRDLVVYPLSFAELCAHEHAEIAQSARHIDTPVTTETSAVLRRLFDRYFKLGGFPRVWTTGDVSLLGEYYHDIVNRDIVRRRKLRQPQYLARFGACVMSDVGRRVNKSRLASTIGVREANTVNKYFDYFEECFLGFEIRLFDRSVRRQLRNPSKWYAIDPVLAGRIGVRDSSRNAFYLENFVLIELLRRSSEVTYWQDRESGAEIDFVVESAGGDRSLVQVAWNIDTRQTLARELRGFEAFEHRHRALKVHRKILVTVDPPPSGLESPSDVMVVTFPRWALASAA